MVEQNHQRLVASIEHERMALEESLRTQQHRIAHGKESLSSGLVGQVDMTVLRRHAAVSIQLQRLAQRTVLELAGVHRRLDAARQELIEAAKQRRVVERLREQRFEQWKAQQEKAETDAIDELAVMAAARRRGVL